MASLVLALIAFAMFLLYSFGVNIEVFNLGWMGLALLALAVALNNWPSNWGRRVN